MQLLQQMYTSNALKSLTMSLGENLRTGIWWFGSPISLTLVVKPYSDVATLCTPGVRFCNTLNKIELLKN